MSEECQSELKVDKSEVTHGLLTMVEPAGVGELINCEDYSSFTKQLSVTAKVLQFCRLTRPHVSIPPDQGQRFYGCVKPKRSQ